MKALIYTFLLSLTLFSCTTDEATPLLRGKWAKMGYCPETALFDFEGSKLYYIDNNCQQVGSIKIDYTIDGGTVKIYIPNEPELIHTNFQYDADSFSWSVGNDREYYLRIE